MSVSGVSAGSSSIASRVAGNLATTGALGILAVAAAAFSPVRAEVEHPPAIQQAEAEALEAARKKLAETEAHINRLSGDSVTRDQRIEHAQYCISYVRQIQNVNSSTALERTAAQNRAHDAAVLAADLVVQGRDLTQAGFEPGALVPWIRQIHFLDAAGRFAPNPARAAEYFQSAIDVVGALRRDDPNIRFLHSDEQLIASLPDSLRAAQEAQRSSWVTSIKRGAIVGLCVLIIRLLRTP